MSLFMKTKPKQHDLLEGVEASTLQSRGPMEILGLTRSGSKSVEAAIPTDSLRLTRVTDYGTMVLQNDSASQWLVVPPHVGFFQHGAQNHATARALVMKPGQQQTVTDCFCIQAAQGGLLQKAEQRFLMLPAGLRGVALSKKHVDGYSRLWDNIDKYTRSFGIARGGHLERLLRPNFRHLLPFRHYFEVTENQVGAAWFVANEITGIEICPSPAYFAAMFPIYNIYCFGPEALLAERLEKQTLNEPVNLNALVDIADLKSRLQESRDAQRTDRVRAMQELLSSDWREVSREPQLNWSVSTIRRSGWAGQVIREGEEIRYLSVFRSET